MMLYSVKYSCILHSVFSAVQVTATLKLMIPAHYHAACADTHGVQRKSA